MIQTKKTLGVSAEISVGVHSIYSVTWADRTGVRASVPGVVGSDAIDSAAEKLVAYTYQLILPIVREVTAP